MMEFPVQDIYRKMAVTLESRALADHALKSQVAYSATIGAIAWLLVLLRLQSKRLAKTIGLDDIFILLALVKAQVPDDSD
jgi:hypothetical protein